MTAIRASRVIGTDVKDTNGETIGKVEDLILDKTENAIMFAVVGFGGVLGIGEKFHPVPWSSLDYEEDGAAYVVPFTQGTAQGGARRHNRRAHQERRHENPRSGLRVLQGRAVLELTAAATRKTGKGAVRRAAFRLSALRGPR